jgi:hypothetical protein
MVDRLRSEGAWFNNAALKSALMRGYQSCWELRLSGDVIACMLNALSKSFTGALQYPLARHAFRASAQ